MCAFSLDKDKADSVRTKAMELAGIGLYRCTKDRQPVFIDSTAEDLLNLKEDPAVSESLPPAPEKGLVVSQVDVEVPSSRGKKWVACAAFVDEEAIPGAEHVQYVLQDVTTRKQRELTVENERTFFRHLIQYSTAPTFVLDRLHRVIIWNKACEELTGVKESEVLGTHFHWKAFYDHERPCLADVLLDGRVTDLPRYYASWGRSPVMPEGLYGEGWFQNLCGKKRYLVFNAVPVPGAEGESAAVIETLQDITDTKTATEALRLKEEELCQVKKMEAVGRLAGGIAHDFNNLLTSILGYSGLLRQELGDGHPAVAEVDEVIRASERAAELTKQLLSLSRKHLVHTEIVGLNATIRGILSMLQRTVGPEIQVVSSLSPQVQGVVGNTAMLEQVLMNLALNARDAMPAGGRLSVSTSLVELGPAECELHEGVKPGIFVRWVVSDTGQGIPPDVRGHLFEPFFTTKPKDKGTGLGLSTVYTAIRQFYGFIEVESEPGAGATFILYLPHVASAGSAARAAEPHAAGGTETILLAEDEDTVRSLEVRVLTSLGYHVLEATNGLEALQKSREFPGEINLVVTDVVMPNLGGQQLADEIEKQRPGIRVLFTSGFTNGALKDRLRGNVGSVLLKPYTPDQLAKKVRQMLDGPAT